MTREQYLLDCISEECGEVIQEIGKAKRFGLDDLNPKTKESNENAIHREILDVLAVYLMAFPENNAIDLNGISMNAVSLIKEKQAKVEKWMKYSIEKGVLDEDKTRHLVYDKEVYDE